jgi:hypothetical protein
VIGGYWPETTGVAGDGMEGDGEGGYGPDGGCLEAEVSDLDGSRDPELLLGSAQDGGQEVHVPVQITEDQDAHEGDCIQAVSWLGSTMRSQRPHQRLVWRQGS